MAWSPGDLLSDLAAYTAKVCSIYGPIIDYAVSTIECDSIGLASIVAMKTLVK